MLLRYGSSSTHCSSSSFLALPLLLTVLVHFCLAVHSSSSSITADNNIDNNNNNDNDDESSSAFGAACPAISAFSFWLRRQCPVFMDTRCANAFPSDVPTPSGQLSCALAPTQRNPRLRQLSAREFLASAKRRDPFGRPLCMLTLFYSPDCVFSAKVADTFFRVALVMPKLRVVAVDVSVGGKGTENLISHYGISSTPVIALWQDGFPRYRLYDDYSQMDTLLRVLRSHTDVSTPVRNGGQGDASKTAFRHEQQTNDEQAAQQQQLPNDVSGTGGENGGGPMDAAAATTTHHHSQWEPNHAEFLAQFHYLKQHLGFDWYLFAAVVTCLVNCVYFLVSSQKGRALLRRHFPQHLAAIVLQ